MDGPARALPRGLDSGRLTTESGTVLRNLNWAGKVWGPSVKAAGGVRSGSTTCATRTRRGCCKTLSRWPKGAVVGARVGVDDAAVRVAGEGAVGGCSERRREGVCPTFAPRPG